MKKIIAAIILVTALLGLVAGCAKKELTPIEKAQARAVEIGKQYLNFEITGAEARKLLDAINVPETESGKGQIYLKGDIAGLSFYIAKDGTPYEEIQERVDRIASNDYNE